MIGNTSFSHMSYSIAKSVFYFIQTEMYGQAASGFSVHACVNLILFTHKYYIIRSTHAYMYRCVHRYIIWTKDMDLISCFLHKLWVAVPVLPIMNPFPAYEPLFDVNH